VKLRDSNKKKKRQRRRKTRNMKSGWRALVQNMQNLTYEGDEL